MLAEHSSLLALITKIASHSISLRRVWILLRLQITLVGNLFFPPHQAT